MLLTKLLLPQGFLGSPGMGALFRACTRIMGLLQVFRGVAVGVAIGVAAGAAIGVAIGAAVGVAIGVAVGAAVGVAIGLVVDVARKV